MKKTENIKKNELFKEIYSTGKSYANHNLVMYIKRNKTQENRLGISVSKKVGNSVIRHRITRLIRESYRLNEERILEGLDIVVVARIGAKGKSYSEIEGSLLHLMKLHGILVKHTTPNR
ncbi:MAG TPA: ribonuclease P protein component [Clostridiales bacterium]|jgi:ribonuclease P protein component|nr:ribonuclease P protein component [Clostridiales bacterium]